jgi:nifR3 family TIM-barrel protein
MSSNFWNKLKKPIIVLAPMADVTDVAFRRIIAKYGKPDVMWTEFVSADGLVKAPEEGKKKLLKDLEYSEAERPIVAQFFTSSPENMEKACRLAKELGFDGVDINMGCPDKSIEKQLAGAALIKNPKLARELIKAAKRGAGDLPVSVKTRVGYSKVELEEWLPELLAEEPAVLIVHARTRKEMSKVSARWEFVKRAVEIRDEFALRQAQDKNKQTLIFGNGDVRNLEEARARVVETGCDGVMLGRAIFGNPWLFSEYVPTLKEKLLVMVEHTKLFEKLLGEYKNFSVMKKHYKAYVNGFDGAVELRTKLMNANNAREVEKIVNGFLKNNG